MKQVIITGKPGAGKTTLLNALKKQGFKTISCDEIVVELYKIDHAGYQAIKKHLGNNFVNDQSVDKKALWDGLNTNQITLDQLNRLIHPLINQELKKSRFNFAECPIVGSRYFDAKHFKILQLVVDDEIAIKRIMMKNHVSQEQAIKTMRLFQDNIKNDVEFNTTHEINSTLIQKVIDYYQNL